ncbi:MAG TPA: hypothetical protein VFR49_11465 [Solirubrobacteraceae bacterium]|nr:hypothetical protein [Solirubrobacteraceae bacterium]
MPGISKRLSTAALLLAAAAPAAPALAAAAPPKVAAPKTPSVIASRHLWATIDACNPADKPRVVGVRGSMPGTGLKTEEMFMRFQIQYQSGTEWKYVPSADTSFRDVGSATYKARQAGQFFTIPAGHYVLRGVVIFQWRRRGHAVLRATRMTTPSHTSLAGADPAGYSAAACALP